MELTSCMTFTLDGAIILDVEVTPNSSRQGIVEFNEWRQRLVIAVKAPALKGKANTAVLHVLRTQCHLKSHQLSIVSGHLQRQKKIRIEEAQPTNLLDMLKKILEVDDSEG